MKSMKISNFGPIKEADVEFGDLTVFVGPQATGKSLFLQFLNLAIDYKSIVKTLKKYGYTLNEINIFFELYFGKNMFKNWTSESQIEFNKKNFSLEKILRSRPKNDDHLTFYIPAHRALIMDEGWPRPFSNLVTFPFVVRDFSERLRLILETGLGKGKALFPQEGRLKSAIRNKIQETIFRTASIKVETEFKKRLVIEFSANGNVQIPVSIWSSGQREFMPLLLGLYYLTPVSKTATKSKVKTVIIEEPEMGLHPEAILGVMFAVMELIWRGYKVLISTHSIHILELIWALNEIKDAASSSNNKLNAFLELFNTKTSRADIKNLAEICLKKSYKLYFFQPGDNGQSITKDITSLDSFAEDPAISGWGGLSQFSSNIVDIVAEINAE